MMSGLQVTGYCGPGLQTTVGTWAHLVYPNHLCKNLYIFKDKKVRKKYVILRGHCTCRAPAEYCIAHVEHLLNTLLHLQTAEYCKIIGYKGISKAFLFFLKKSVFQSQDVHKNLAQPHEMQSQSLAFSHFAVLLLRPAAKAISAVMQSHNNNISHTWTQTCGQHKTQVSLPGKTQARVR